MSCSLRNRTARGAAVVPEVNLSSDGGDSCHETRCPFKNEMVGNPVRPFRSAELSQLINPDAWATSKAMARSELLIDRSNGTTTRLRSRQERRIEGQSG